ncbi:GNAT family N-acetyltransferase [Actinopolyspora mortivallis]|uniref:GNAT family N-acetyltransferase n=1 Tax=Actinopolyspora mortivallis TaxID=33906 RepID=A0A2T0GZR8_ACTMO|nr:GNAT family N-acetyltransferase [Actinopolyspora mortivallis]PRW64605.1 GNAT family N-acetyltransferase [Actinopolyspora mortivallis]
MDPKEKRTERLTLRPVRPEDEPAMVAVHTDPGTNLHRPDGAPAPERVKSDLEEWIRQWREHGIGYWAVEATAEARLVGFGGLRRDELAGSSALNLYYRFRPEAWGRGYAVELGTAAVELARTRFPGTPVVIRTRPNNAPARRVAERLGFERRVDHEPSPPKHVVYLLPDNTP